MAPKPKRPATSTTEADRLAVEALLHLDVFKSLDPACDLDQLRGLKSALEQAEEAERQALLALEAAREQKAAAAWALHGGVTSAKFQVFAQFGPDSTTLRSLGLKRRSERRPPTRKTH